MAHIKDVETFMHNMLASMADESRQEAKEFGQQAGWVAAELDHWRQRCEELEIELECLRNAFPEHDNDIQPKTRGIF